MTVDQAQAIAKLEARAKGLLVEVEMAKFEATNDTKHRANAQAYMKEMYALIAQTKGVN